MSELSLFHTLRELQILLRHGSHMALEPFHLSVTQYDTLRQLDEAVGVRMGDLCARVLCDNSKMTRMVDYFEQQGWARRVPDPTDRRAQQVWLTPAGATQLAQAAAAHETAVSHMFALFDEQVQGTLLTHLDGLRVWLREKFEIV